MYLINKLAPSTFLTQHISNKYKKTNALVISLQVDNKNDVHLYTDS